MELHTLLGEVVKTHGRDIINDQRVVNILSDYNVYADNPQFKFIIKNIISEGYSNKILDIKETVILNTSNGIPLKSIIVTFDLLLS